jgi:hypothetical protein
MVSTTPIPAHTPTIVSSRPPSTHSDDADTKLKLQPTMSDSSNDHEHEHERSHPIELSKLGDKDRSADADADAEGYHEKPFEERKENIEHEDKSERDGTDVQHTTTTATATAATSNTDQQGYLHGFKLWIVYFALLLSVFLVSLAAWSSENKA